MWRWRVRGVRVWMQATPGARALAGQKIRPREEGKKTKKKNATDGSAGRDGSDRLPRLGMPVRDVVAARPQPEAADRRADRVGGADEDGGAVAEGQQGRHALDGQVVGQAGVDRGGDLGGVVTGT